MSAPTAGSTKQAEAVEPISARAVRSLSTKGMTKVPTVLQIEAVECGAACLGMVLASLGRWVQLEELRTTCGVSRDGVTALDIVHAARSYGLEARGHRGDIRKLDHLDVPAIIWWRKNHFVVLEGIRKGRFRINDPAVGRRTVDPEEFLESYSGAAITFTKTPEFTKGGHRFRLIPSLAGKLKHSKDGVALAFFAGTLALIPALVVPIFTQIFVDEVLQYGEARAIPWLVGGLVLVAAVSVLLNQVQNSALVRLQTKLSLVGTARLLEHLLRMPMPFFWQRSIGDLSNRMSFPVSVAQVLAGQVASALISLLSIVAYGFLMFYYDWQLATIVLALAVGSAITLRLIIRAQVNTQLRLTRELAEVQGVTVKMAQSIETIKASGAENDAFIRWNAAQVRATNAEAKMSGKSAAISVIPVLTVALTAAVVLVVGGLNIIDGTMTLGALVAFQMMAAGINAPISQLSNISSAIQVTAASVERIDDVVQQDPDPRFAHDRPKFTTSMRPKLAGRLEFRNVTYGYQPTAPPLIKDFNLVIEPGHRVALVGVSGAGKSTIANLAAGLLQPWSGEVLYDGQPLAEIPVGVLEHSLAKVDQSIVLFQATVRENLTLWDSSVPDEVLVQALADAQLLTDIRRRPGGLKAMVVEGGRNFSGGQQQRLELARALVGEPTLVILDEATSALDPVSERAVGDALRARGCACLIVAHRLSTVRDSDQIVVLDRGGAEVERGSHDELLAHGGAYARLVSEAGEGGDVGSA